MPDLIDSGNNLSPGPARLGAPSESSAVEGGNRLRGAHPAQREAPDRDPPAAGLGCGAGEGPVGAGCFVHERLIVT
jgi:hypothetical protein